MWNPPWKEELGGSKNFTSPNFSSTNNQQQTYSAPYHTTWGIMRQIMEFTQASIEKQL